MKPVRTMHHSIRVTRLPWRAWPPGARAGAAVTATATAALLAACSGPSSASPASAPGAAGSASPPSAVSYSHCMRARGVPNFPDPDANGQVPKTDPRRLGVSATQLRTAQQACQYLLPAVGPLDQQARQCLPAGDCPPSLVQRLLTADRSFARCMRSHGVPSWPDPSVDPQGRPAFNLVPVGITHSQTHSPPLRTTMDECNRLVPAAWFGLGSQ